MLSKKFLADYGLIWVGKGAEDASDNADAATDTAADSWIPGINVLRTCSKSISYMDKLDILF